MISEVNMDETTIQSKTKLLPNKYTALKGQKWILKCVKEKIVKHACGMITQILHNAASSDNSGKPVSLHTNMKNRFMEKNDHLISQ